ncbi:MAG: glycosyltransferase [Bacteroidetes bacterium]|nr:MAG: glycosyltransferase [Bacteroidota bacterium]
MLRAHNVEYKIWESIALQTKSKFSANEENKTPFFKRFYTKYLSRKLKRYELDIAQKVDLVWTLSNEDSLELSAHGVETKLIPVSVELSQKDHDYSKNVLYHIGGMEWSPNRSAINILQDLMRKMNDDAVKLHLIGRGIQESDQKGIIVHGFVEDLESLLSEMGILVAPIISGSGIRIKILESMAQGIPVITTSIGAKGIIDKNVLAIGDDPETFTNRIKEFVYSKETRERFGRLGKEYIRIHHNSAVISTEIKNSLKLNTIDLNQKTQ